MDQKDTKIGFIGQGWIGKHYADNFEQRGFGVVRYAKEWPHIQNGEQIKDCDIVFIAVPTPTTPQGFDDSILREAVKLVGYKKTAVIKSTVLPGTTESIQRENPNIFVLHSPEFLREANVVYDAANPQRNIIGLPSDNEEYRQKAREVLAVLPSAPYELICSAREAELIKYGGNGFLASKIIFINILYDLVKKLGCRWEIVREAMAADPRIGGSHLNPVFEGGRGAGKHCFIKDFEAFARMYENLVGDKSGVETLRAIINKNADLLISTNKDVDILAGVYGEEFIEQRKAQLPKKPRCLVTGGAGFIGSHLVDELIERGFEVVVIDNLFTGKIENVNPAAEFHELDIRNLQDIKSLFQDVDYVFHLAALPRVQPSIENPILTHDINLNGTLNVLIAASEAKAKKVIYSSSSSVYGMQKEMPLREHMPSMPMSPYALQKYVGERYCRLFSEIYGLPTVSLRYFNVYGKRQVLEGVYALVGAIFVGQRLRNEPMTVVGDGEQRRDFTGVGDVVRAIILAAESDKVGRGEVINIGRGKNYSVNEVAQIIGGPTVNIPPRIEPRQTLADNSRARELLGWEPQGDFPAWLEEYKKEMGLE